VNEYGQQRWSPGHAEGDRPWGASAPCPCWDGRCLVDLARGLCPGACVSLATWALRVWGQPGRVRSEYAPVLPER
jgi:hypothetical protein